MKGSDPQVLAALLLAVIRSAALAQTLASQTIPVTSENYNRAKTGR
jgi:hypothetical protein